MKKFKRQPGAPRTRRELVRQLRALAARVPDGDERIALMARLNTVLPGKTK